jgi:hypothetical protein
MIISIIFTVFILRLFIALEVYYILFVNNIDLYSIDVLTLALLMIAVSAKILKNNAIPKYFLILLIVICFYLLYSFYLNIVPYKAILSDVLQFKPFLVFFMTYYLFEGFSKKHKQLIRYVCYFNIFLMIMIVLTFSEWRAIMHNRVDITLTATITGLVYLWSSSQKKRDIIITMLIFSIGLPTGRAKMYGFYLIALSVFLFLNKTKIELSKKTIAMLIILVPIMTFATYSKITEHFTEASNISIRPFLYIGAWNVLNEYFPFGSGFATYASQASSDYLSPVAYEYIPKMFLEEKAEYYSMQDVYYPRLAQFGWVGAFLFILFWIKNFKKCSYYCDITKNLIIQKIFFLIIAFFAVESIAYYTLVTPQGTTAMMFFAMVLKTEKMRSEQNINRILLKG